MDEKQLMDTVDAMVAHGLPELGYTYFNLDDCWATGRTADGTLIADLNPKEGGFISGVWRVIQRERTKHRVALSGPLTLVRYDNGRIAIPDPSTGWSADLMGFGIDNAKAFARLLAQ